MVHRRKAKRAGTPGKAGVINGSSDPTPVRLARRHLVAHAILDARQRDAADRFRRARAACFGAVLANTDPATRREATEVQIARNERRYSALTGLLTEDQLGAVVDLALDLRSPWMGRALLGRPPIAGDQEARQALLSGLDCLADADR